MARVVSLALLLAVAVGVTGCGLGIERASNPLYGAWEVRSDGLKPGAIGAVGYRELLFVEDAMYAGNLRIPVEYEMDRDQVEVRGNFGETYVYEILDADLICLPAFRVQALDRGEALSDEALRERICYRRV